MEYIEGETLRGLLNRVEGLSVRHGVQSLIFTTILYAYGLGFYGRVGPAREAILTFLIYMLQVLLSVWWLRHFRFGPAEWLWRTLTYGRLQPMRV